MSESKRIYLPDGQSYPVGAASLAEEHATPTIAGVRSPWAESVAGGINPAKVARILREAAAQDGDAREYLALLEEIEERESHYRSQLMTRKLAIRGLDPVVEATAEAGKPVVVADEIRAIVRTPRFRRMTVDLLDGISKGYSVVEMIWDTRTAPWLPIRFEWRDPRWFQYDRVTGRELRLRSDVEPAGEALPPGKYIVFEPRLKSGLPIRGGLGRTVVWLFLLKTFTLQDWMTFLDVYGVPIRVGKWGTGASEADKRTLMRAVANLVSDAAVTIPASMVIELMEAKASGTDAHERASDFVNKEISKVVVGQTMTSEDGSSLAQAEVHDRVRLDIAEADADDVADAIQIGFVEVYCALNHGLTSEDCPQLRLPVPKPKDMEKRMKVIAEFVGLGGRVSEAEVRDEIGLADPGEDRLLAVPSAARQSGDEGSDQDDDSADKTPPPRRPALNRHAAGCPCCGRLQLHRAGGQLDETETLIEGDYEAMARPLLEPLIEAALGASSFDDALARLADAGPDGSVLAGRLANLMAIGRGIGDLED